MLEFALSVSLIVFPFTVVPGAVLPGLYAFAVSEGADPFAFVNGPTFESVGFSEFSDASLSVDPLDDLLAVPVFEVVVCSHVFTGYLLVVFTVLLSRNHFS